MNFCRLFWLFIVLFHVNAFGQFNPFKESGKNILDEDKVIRKHDPSTYKTYQFDLPSLIQWTVNAPELSNDPSELILALPNTDGSFSNYWVYNNSAMEPELAESVPNIRSLKAVDIKNKGNHVSISISDVFGLHAMGMKTDGTVFYIDNYTKDRNTVMVYERADLATPQTNFMCYVTESDYYQPTSTFDAQMQTLSFDNKRRNFRVAIACTTEYAAFHINNAPAGVPNTTLDDKKNIVLAAMNVTLTRLNQIFEREINVHLNLIADNKDIIFITSDNFDNDNAGVLINQSQTVIDNTIGSSKYDIGHTFSTGGGGLAQLGSVCSNSKARGITGSAAPVGDPYDVDYVAHEMGHQFGANHTFNNSCFGNINPPTAMEPGSGSTIMSYAGICFPNVQSNVDPYYHYISIREMQLFLSTATCAQQVTTQNAAPNIPPFQTKTIPYGTPFILSTTATDANGDQLTYTFEQLNTQISPQPPESTSVGGPVFRNIAPTESNYRSFPNVQTVLAGTTENNGIVSNEWETLSTVARGYNFVAMVRDNNAFGARVVYTQPFAITVANTGPFVITAPNNNPNTSEPVWYMGDTKTITWNVAGTTANNINTSNVNILVSTDNGTTYTTLVANTPNDGSETVSIPTNLTSTYQARIKIEAVGNIFYTVSKKFTLWDPNLSVDELAIDEVKLYPNPTTSILNITFKANDTEKITFDVYDLNGRWIQSTTNTTYSNEQQINVEGLKTGTYILVIRTGTYTFTHKFIKN
ncbi:MAG: T9SS type A sorting domain-containing protein [Myroides sp.]|nr:T9SS type A sorting domain-containing protein [Myroides sp.]